MIAYAALAAAVVAVAWSAIFVRWADIPGSASAFYRVLIAACVLLPWRAMHTPAGARRQRPGRRAWLMAVAAGVFFALDLAFFNTAIMRGSASTTSLLGSNAPVFVGLGSWIVFRRRPHGWFWTGLVASMTGIAMMIWAGAAASSAAPGDPSVRHDLAADFMAIAAAFCFAGYLLAVAEARDRMDTLTLNTIAMAVSTVCLLPICLAIGAPLWDYPASTWVALLWLGIVSQVGAYLLIGYALGHLPATIVSVGLLGQAPLTALLAALLLRERLVPLQLVGGALVLAGIYIVTRADAEPRGNQEDVEADSGPRSEEQL